MYRTCRPSSSHCILWLIYVVPRETREGWPLLTVETEVNGDSKSANEKDLPWLVHWACREGMRDFCSALAASIK